jgi:hypothetical protein
MRLGRKGVRRKRRQDSKARTKSRSPNGVAAELRLQSKIPPAHSTLRVKPTLPPITDASGERETIVKQGLWAWEKSLIKRALAKPVGEVTVSPTEIEDRICEVYRQCFDDSRRRDLSVLTEFVKRFPSLIFRCGWIEELVATVATVRNYDEYARRLLRALGDGFRRAGAERDPRRLYRSVRLEAARNLKKKLSSDFSRFLKDLDRHNAQEKWLLEQCQEKVTQINNDYPAVVIAKLRLLGLLKDGKASKAAILVAAKTFSVRERDLESRVDGTQTQT